MGREECAGHIPRYEYTTIDYEHPDPHLRTSDHVSVHLQMDYDELVAGARIEVGS